jgi:hypothetical protein
VDVTLVFCIWWQHWSARASNASRWNFYSTGTKSPDYGFTELRWVSARTISNPEFTCDFNEKPAYVIANSIIEAQHCIFYTAVQEILASVKDGVYTESNNREISWAQGPVNNDSYFRYTHNPPCTSVRWLGKCYTGRAKSIDILLRDKEKTRILESIATFSREGNIPTINNGDIAGGTIQRMLYSGPSVSRAVKSFVHHLNTAFRTENTLSAYQSKHLNDEEMQNTRISEFHRVSGAVYVRKIHVQVRWAWLALSALLLLLTLLLLAAIVITSRHENLGIWKDNPLAILFYTR